MVAHVTTPAGAELHRLPPWVTLVRAPNPGPMTLEGTNTWVLRPPGAREAVVIDPGPSDEGHLAAVAAHAPVAAVLVTHGHPDHVEGVERLLELLGGVPGTVPPGLQRFETPGHTADSVCFHVRVGDDEAIFTGDTILGRGTTVVAWPDRDLGAYLESLDRLAEYQGVPVLPGHGPALADCAAAAQYYLRHRLARLEQVREAVTAGARDADAVVERVYADVDRALWPAAHWSVQAQLEYLRRESQPTRTGLDEP